MQRSARRRLLALAVVCAISALTRVPEACAQEPVVLFSDDFSSGTLTNWTISPLGLMSNWSVVSGAAAYNGGGHTQLFAGSMDWTDYTVEVRFRLDTGSNYPGGLRGRVNTSTGQSYAAWLYPSNGLIKLFRAAAWHIDTPGLAQIDSVSVGSITPGVFHTLSLSFAGSQIVVKYDGATVITASDSAFASGGIALDVSNQPIQFDDVVVTAASGSADTQPPTVTMTAPASGTTVSGTIAVSATASDNVGVAGVQFQLDGASLGPEDTVSPSSTTWNTAAASNGTHSLRAIARDAAGNATTSTAITVTVDNAPSSTLFTDSFDTNSLANWQPSPLGRLDHWSAAAGTAAYDGTGHTQLYAGGSNWLDYTVEAKVRVDTASNYPGGLRGRVNLATGQSYAAWLYPGSNTIKLFRAAGWNIDTPGILELASATLTISPGVFHTVAMTFQGSSIEVKFDGATVLSATDSQLATGAIALDVSNQPIQFDDISVSGTVAPADTIPPTVSITNLTSGQTVMSAQMVTASATDNFAVASVRFTVDGAPLGPADATTPYRAIWDTAAVADGTHTIAAIARDQAGNETTASVTVTVSNALTKQGPGGPILVLTTTADPFSRYYGEILLTEGLNQYRLQDISTLDATLLAVYDVVILPSISLNATQVSVLTTWVNGGGQLIAMRPDAHLASLLGLTASSGTLTNAYLGVNTSVAPGAGIVSQTMQFHGVADFYTVSGSGSGTADTIATLFSDGATSTSHPAITVRSVGTSGGRAAAFTYDLARSVVWTRQGNPAWSAQDRDESGDGLIRSDDLFFGRASFDFQPDWVDLEKVAIPQADEQQRLLVNLIEYMNRDRKPLPRFWYLPRGKRAAVVMTGDDHASSNGTQLRFDSLIASSSSGCSVDLWECVRGSSYIYETTPIANSLVQQYEAMGFEIGLHPVHNDGACVLWSPSALAPYYVSELDAFAIKYPAAPPPETSRTHCITWSDYVTQPKVEYASGIRLDTNYYYWPGAWMEDHPAGLFTGSGMPMRFADVDGTPIDVYEATTQMQDESGQTYPFTIDALLDKALGPEGYYAVLTANMHTDRGEPTTSMTVAIVASAQARGVPVVTGRQMLRWIDGRNRSFFSGISKSGATLSFTVNVASGSDGLQAMVPTASASGTLTAVTRDGTPVTFETQTIKGLSYAVFTAQAGAYQVTYSAP
jgi:hypothetical protein